MLSSISDNNGLSPINPNGAKNSKQNIASNITIVKKGEAGYIEAMDEDNDGKVSLDEFNAYCEKNGVSEQDKLKLMSVIQVGKQTQKIVENSAKQNDDEAQNTDNDKIIYAKKGDDKYDVEMDENKDDVVTYEEYIKYCLKQTQNSDKTSKNKIETEYSKTDSNDESNNAQYSVETNA